ncbi:MAG: CDP-alcohol phosphatidyltransferase family protein [Flavonifractor plautii]
MWRWASTSSPVSPTCWTASLPVTTTRSPDFGKFVDPLADKCLVMAALCWFVEGRYLCRVGTGYRAAAGVCRIRHCLVAVEKGRVIAAGWSGKIRPPAPWCASA